MTYPPQPGDPQGDPNAQGWAQQPGYGQPQYPQQCGWQQPQQPQQPPGWDQQQQYGQPYPTQQYPQQGAWDPNNPGGYGQGFGGPPPQPPKKNKTGLIIGGAIALVVVIALGVTGFVAPGFFLSKDSTTTAAGPDATAQAIVDGLNKKDRAALTALKCGDAEKDIDEVLAALDSVADVKLSGPLTKVSESEYTAVVALTIDGRPGTTKGTIDSAGDKWCWKLVSRFQPTGSSRPTGSPSSTSPSTSPSYPPSAEGAAFIKDFVGKINSGDAAGATALGCPNFKDLLQKQVTEFAVPGAALTAAAEGSSQFVSAEVGGDVNGKKVRGSILAQDSGQGFCVSLFLVFTTP
ncbi:hypothetical protein [Amycolatopsis sp. H20-H5]|uniref:hypothetical protein n=1 Tax=Amycolatopsis sp. H20-H5 TaxID=3046309 RepID=UPI002DB57D53|nr:hypothetical protein [Amycolatopsis sp. H20-H5]MEC3977043.1 hypothetical protein [Amycolatopsis sp. H20-H5]